MWAGNTVAGRLAVAEMSPMVVTAFRWLIVCLLLIIFGWRQVVTDWPEAKPHWKYFLLQALMGFTLFNAIFYYSAHLTSGINLSIIQGSIPVFVFMGAYLWFGTRITRFQMAGVAVSLIGILTVASQGDFEMLKHLSFNKGDMLMLVACLFSAIYALALRTRPTKSAFTFFIFLAFASLLTTLPLLALEYAAGATHLPTAKGWLILGYIAIFPSMLAQMFYIRSVEMVGPGRAGVFINLVPVLGAILSVEMLGENFGLYHALSLVLVLGGIYIAEQGKQPA